jgi:hypothetical protein
MLGREDLPASLEDAGYSAVVDGSIVVGDTEAFEILGPVASCGSANSRRQAVNGTLGNVRAE